MYHSESYLIQRRRFEDYLHRNKLRRTAERFAIFEAVSTVKGHFTADVISEMLSGVGFHVSLATIYSALGLLVDFGYVIRHRFDNQAAAYERVPAEAPHYHLVCIQCGKVKEVRDDEIARLIETKRSKGFSSRYFSLEIYGICAGCQRKKNKLIRSKQ